MGGILYISGRLEHPRREYHGAGGGETGGGIREWEAVQVAAPRDELLDDPPVGAGFKI